MPKLQEHRRIVLYKFREEASTHQPGQTPALQPCAVANQSISFACEVPGVPFHSNYTLHRPHQGSPAC